MYTLWFVIEVTLEVKQGCLMPPALFSYYINDISNAKTSLNWGVMM